MIDRDSLRTIATEESETKPDGRSTPDFHEVFLRSFVPQERDRNAAMSSGAAMRATTRGPGALAFVSSATLVAASTRAEDVPRQER